MFSNCIDAQVSESKHYMTISTVLHLKFDRDIGHIAVNINPVIGIFEGVNMVVKKMYTLQNSQYTLHRYFNVNCTHCEK